MTAKRKVCKKCGLETRRTLAEICDQLTRDGKTADKALAQRQACHDLPIKDDLDWAAWQKAWDASGDSLFAAALVAQSMGQVARELEGLCMGCAFGAKKEDA